MNNQLVRLSLDQSPEKSVEKIIRRLPKSVSIRSPLPLLINTASAIRREFTRIGDNVVASGMIDAVVANIALLSWGVWAGDGCIKIYDKALRGCKGLGVKQKELSQSKRQAVIDMGHFLSAHNHNHSCKIISYRNRSRSSGREMFNLYRGQEHIARCLVDWHWSLSPEDQARTPKTPLFKAVQVLQDEAETDVFFGRPPVGR